MPAMNAPMAKAKIFTRTTSMPDAGRGALVGPHGEHGGAEPAPAELRDAEGDDESTTRTMQAEADAGVVGADPRRRSSPNSVGPVDVLAAGRDEVVVAEPQRLDARRPARA